MDNPTNIYWHRTKRVLKFVWRHLLTIPMIFLLILSICMGEAGNILTWGFCTIWATIMDRAKCNRASRGKATDRSPFDPSIHNKESIPNEPWNKYDPASAAYYINRN